MRRWGRTAALLLAIWCAAVLWTTVVWHVTPLYSVETDTIGEYIPAAQSLMLGHLPAEHYQSKGFGYPAALAAVSVLTGNDFFLAARLLNVACGVLGAAFAYLLFGAFLGAGVAWFVLAGLLLNPLYLRMTVEAGTDVPTFALLMAATFLFLRGSRPRTLFFAGLIAGWAVITRYNSAFLPLAGVVVLLSRRGALPVLRGAVQAAGAGAAMRAGNPAAAPGRWRNLAAYVTGLALPLGTWLILARSAGVNPLGGQNVQNMAYDIYGAGLTPEVFWPTTGARFHTFWDVVRYRPMVLAARLGANLALHCLTDAHKLLPLWLGLLALPGIVVGWWRRPGWKTMTLHLTLCYVVLALVFYLPRFGLYLLPFYLSGAVLLLLRGRTPGPRPLAARSRGATWFPALGVALLVGLILASGWRAVADLREALRDAPWETREAGLLLRELGQPGDRVMARKPNVAYFARMGYSPLPDVTVTNYADFIAAARASRARYLFFSAAEMVTRPQLGILSDTAVVLPGLRPIACRIFDRDRFYVLYELTNEATNPAMLQSAVIAALQSVTARRPELTSVRTQLAGQLLAAGRSRDALAELAISQQLDPRDLMCARMQIQAHEQLGEYEEEAVACERAIRLEPPTGWERARLGWARIQQRRFPEAIAALREALRLEPGNAQYAFHLGLAFYSNGESAAAVGCFEKVLELDPGQFAASLYLGHALRRQGDLQGALRALENARAATGPEARGLRALADTIRAEMGRSGS